MTALLDQSGFVRLCRQVLLGVVCISLLLATACSGPRPDKSTDEAAATAHDGKATTVANRVAEVILPSGSVAGGTRVKATSSVLSDPHLVGLTPLSQAFHVDLGSSTLTGDATISFPAPESLSNDLVPVVVWQDGHGGWQWVPTAWSPGESRVVATVGHFSSGFLGGLDIKARAVHAAANLKNYITGRFGAAQPTCRKPTTDPDIRVRASGGDRVFWCVGEQDDHLVLKVVNNTRTFSEVSYPSSWKVLDGLSASLDTNAVARFFGSKVHEPAGISARIVDGGDQLTLQVPPGGTGQVVVQMSIVAWAVSAAAFGGETLLAVAGAAGGSLAEEAKGRLDRLALFAGLGTSKEEAEEAPKECVQAMADLTGDLDADTAKAIALFGFRCGSKLAAGLLLGGGAKIYAIGALVSMVVSFTNLVLTAVNLLVTGTREVWDAVASFAGRSDNVFQIDLQHNATSEVPQSSRSGDAGNTEVAGCAQVLSSYYTVLDKFDREQATTLVEIDAITSLKDSILSSPCAPPKPVAKLIVRHTSKMQQFEFDASASTGVRLTFVINPRDINWPEIIVTGQKTSPFSNFETGSEDLPPNPIVYTRKPGKIKYTYSVPGTFNSYAQVFDAFGRVSSVEVAVKA